MDGPLNPYAAKPSRRPDGYTTHRLRPIGWREHERRRPLRVWLNPAQGEQLLALPYDLVWCTTWEHEANTMIGPALGLPELPVIEFPNNALDTAGGLFWKTRHVVEWAGGRPFAWVDDDITGADEAFVSEQHQGRALLRLVSPRLGLLAPDFELLAAWAAEME
ncbi:hypothetical protein AB0I84_13155 [Streptomyces spectabilis]|uniref:hypothetical protein n=1 Tax=Streptomyces spectabilis TaxID=68270 RepID=UPI0033F59A77